MPSMSLQLGAFNGLNSLNRIILSHINMLHNIHYKWLEPVAHCLHSITLMRIVIPVHLYNIIGAIQMRIMRRVFYGELEFGGVLTKHSITNVPYLNILYLTQCGIEIIEIDAFDYFSNVLDGVILKRNKLKTIPFQIFSRHSLCMEPNSYTNNPIECDCNIIEIQKYCENLFHNICTLSNEQQDCRSLQIENKLQTRHCMKHYGTNFLRIIYPKKFLIRIDYNENIIFVKSPMRTIFYLLTFNELNPIHSIKCLKTTAKYSAFSLYKIFVSSKVFLVCILDSEHKLWPLNCITFRFSPTNDLQLWLAEREKFIILILFGITITIIFLIAILLGTFLAKRNPILLRGLNRVLIHRNRRSNKIESVLVMPVMWTDSQKAKKLQLNENSVDKENEYDIYMEHN